MNHEDNSPDLQTHIEPELEARLVASVLGEASAFEAAELERLMLEKPELEIFKRRIEAVHGLIGSAVRPEQAPLRLAPERRLKLLAAMGATPATKIADAATAEANQSLPAVLALTEARRKRRKQWIWGCGLAASVMFATAVTVRMLPDLQPTRPEPSQTLLGPSAVAVELPALQAEPPPSAQEEVLVLSPFQVASSPTLAGRLRKALTQAAPAEPETAPRAGGAGGRSGDELRRREADVSNASAAPHVVQFNSVVNAERADKPRGPDPLRLGLGSSDGVIDGAAKRAVVARDFDANDKKKSATYVPSLQTIEAPKSDSYNFVAGEKAEKRADHAGLLTLSPFTVDSAKDAGYAAGSTIAGTRLNSPSTPPIGGTEWKAKIDDLASSLSVVTKQQLSDRAAIDVNDVFLNERSSDTATAAKEFAFALPAAVVDERLSQQKIVAPAAPAATESTRTETNAAKEPVSTFSLHVSDVSFRLAQTALARGEMPDPTRIRPEEFYNAFDYGDPSPTTTEKVSARIEQAAHPLLQQRNLVRIAMKVASSGRGAGQPLHLTILLDTSGSMERADRIASVQRALATLASLLGANDRVTLIGFARQPRLLAEQLSGDQATKLAELASHTPFEGGTNLEEALKLAGELARRHRVPAAQNRIVLITDGAANLGNADPVQLTAMVEALRQQSIALDACGVGTDGLDDTVLEALTRKGDGRYYVLNQAEDADAGFARQLAGAFRPAAENVKVQVRFNPARVGRYRLIGFEQHRLREEDFRNDQVDAAELAADEAAVALYQIEVLPQGQGELGDVFVRFRDAATGNMVERSWTMLHDPRARAFDRATPTLQLAGTAALLADKLSGGDVAGLVNLDELVSTVNALRGHYAKDARVQELITMFEQLRRRSGK